MRLRFASIKKYLGVNIRAQEAADILSRLGFAIMAEDNESIKVEVPSYRFDVSIEADLIEELARIFGYDNIPQSSGLSSQRFAKSTETSIEMNRLRDHLVALGYQEIITYSFIDPALSELISGSEQVVTLQNPISEEMGVMRCSLLPGLLSSYQHNANRQHERLRFFETGLVFKRSGEEIQQEARVGGLIAGSQLPKSWSNRRELSNFYDLKGDVEVLLGLGGKTGQLSFLSSAETGYHPGQCAEIRTQEGDRVGVLGALHPTIQRELHLDQSVFVFELRLDTLLKARMPQVKALSKYPEVQRDLAIVIDEAVSADSISNVVRASAGEFLIDLRIFDVYQGDTIVKGQKSVALGLTWQHPSRTLSDVEVNTIISNCVNAIQEQFNADLRK